MVVTWLSLLLGYQLHSTLDVDLSSFWFLEFHFSLAVTIDTILMLLYVMIQVSNIYVEYNFGNFFVKIKLFNFCDVMKSVCCSTLKTNNGLTFMTI